tara:strand:+ start:103 stop:258 length:156 start_codon:yes stop_codon:yes gene_type:complete
LEIIEINIMMARIRDAIIAVIDTQSPCLGNFLPKNICITKANKGRSRIYNE